MEVDNIAVTKVIIGKILWGSSRGGNYNTIIED